MQHSLPYLPLLFERHEQALLELHHSAPKLPCTAHHANFEVVLSHGALLALHVLGIATSGYKLFQLLNYNYDSIGTKAPVLKHFHALAAASSQTRGISGWAAQSFRPATTRCRGGCEGCMLWSWATMFRQASSARCNAQGL